MNTHKCCKCGKKAVAKVNDKVWLCAECAMDATITSLSMGQPVVQALKGEVQCLIVPTGPQHNNN